MNDSNFPLMDTEANRIKTDLCSRPNTLNGKYKLAKVFGLENTNYIQDTDIFYLQTLRMTADHADKLFFDAEEVGRDLSNPDVLREIGLEINSLGTPIHKREALTTAFFVSIRLVLYYTVILGIWGFVFERLLSTFIFVGAFVGLFISIFSVAPVVSGQRTRERIKNIVLGAGLVWVSLGIVVGLLGLIALVVRVLLI
jgi:hypothetical protein